MLTELAPHWPADLERGPDWLFIRLQLPDDLTQAADGLAERIWGLLDQGFTNRLVVELDRLPMLPSALIGQLVILHKRVVSSGGIMRLSGLTDSNYQVLCHCRLDGRFPRYGNRNEAVMGYRPRHPR